MSRRRRDLDRPHSEFAKEDFHCQWSFVSWICQINWFFEFWMLALPYLWCQSLRPEFVSATIQIRQCCIPIGCNVLLLSLKLDVLHRTSHPEFKPGRDAIIHTVKYEAQNLMRPTLDLNKIQATITTAHQLHPAISGIFRKFRMRPIEVCTTPCTTCTFKS